MYVSTLSLEKWYHLSNYTYIVQACLHVLSQNKTVLEWRNSAPDMLKVIHVSSHSDRVRLYIMYLRQISLKKIDIRRNKVGDTVPGFSLGILKHASRTPCLA